ncbi:MAG: tail fiber domain-containing protein [Nonlabens sp.]
MKNFFTQTGSEIRAALLFFLFNMMGGYLICAQNPDGFSYQSIIRDAAGTEITNSQIRLKMSVLQGSATGTVVYSENFTTMTNNSGLVTLNIGTGSSTVGAFNQINWGANDYFIMSESDVDNNGSYDISSTVQLLSVPYAMHAKTVDQGDNLGDHQVDTTILLNDNWISNDGGSEGIRISNDGKVGIGTTTPSNKLDVNGNVNIDGNLQIENTGTIFTKNSAGASIEAYTPRNASDNTVMHFGNGAFFTTVDNNTRGTRMVMTSDGNLGIGTTNPSKKLDINGGVNVSGSGVFLKNTGNIFAKNNAGAIAAAYTPRDSNNNSIFNIGNHGYFRTVTNNQVRTRLFVGNAGRIGIGTTSPSSSAILDVRGPVIAAGYLNHSDRRLKKDIKPISGSLEKILDLNPVSYTYKDDKFNTGTRIGFIAQELVKVMPEVVVSPKKKDEYYSVRYTEIVPYNVQAIQQQQAMISELKEDIEKLKQELAELRKTSKN